MGSDEEFLPGRTTDSRVCTVQKEVRKLGRGQSSLIPKYHWDGETIVQNVTWVWLNQSNQSPFMKHPTSCFHSMGVGTIGIVSHI